MISHVLPIALVIPKYSPYRCHALPCSILILSFSSSLFIYIVFFLHVLNLASQHTVYIIDQYTVKTIASKGLLHTLFFTHEVEIHIFYSSPHLLYYAYVKLSS